MSGAVLSSGPGSGDGSVLDREDRFRSKFPQSPSSSSSSSSCCSPSASGSSSGFASASASVIGIASSPSINPTALKSGERRFVIVVDGSSREWALVKIVDVSSTNTPEISGSVAIPRTQTRLSVYVYSTSTQHDLL